MLKLKQLFTIAIVVFVGTSAVSQTVTNDAAQEMINAYKRTKAPTLGHLYSASRLRDLVQPSYVKSVFAFKGLDGDNKEYVILKRVAEDGKMIDQSFAVGGDPKPPGLPCCGEEFGKQIDEMVAQQRVSSFQASTDRKVAIFSKASIEGLLALKDVQGIYFANVIDNTNSTSLIAIGFNSKGELLTDGAIVMATLSESDYPLLNSSIKK
jgi:hypothetical protein